MYICDTVCIYIYVVLFLIHPSFFAAIGFALLARLPVIFGLYSSFVPPLVYAILGSSRHISVGEYVESDVSFLGHCIIHPSPEQHQ